MNHLNESHLGWSFKKTEQGAELLLSVDEGGLYTVFETKMISRQIPGIFNLREDPDLIYGTYAIDVGQCIPITQALIEGRFLSKSALIDLIQQMLGIINAIRSRMLLVERIWWSFDHLYWNDNDSKLGAIYLPQGGSKWQQLSFQRFLRSLLCQYFKKGALQNDVLDLIDQISEYCLCSSFSERGLTSLLSHYVNTTSVPTQTQNQWGSHFSSKEDMEVEVSRDKKKVALKVGKWPVHVLLLVVLVLGYLWLPDLTGDTTDAYIGWTFMLLGLDLFYILFVNLTNLKKPVLRDFKEEIPDRRVINTGHHQPNNETMTELLRPENIEDDEFPYLVHKQTGEIYKLDKARHVIGRHIEQSDCIIESNVVGRMHAQIFVEHNRLAIIDLSSKNGTFINGESLETGRLHYLEHGDELMFGDYCMTYNIT